jgi:hypothetical protein
VVFDLEGISQIMGLLVANPVCKFNG